MPNLPTGTVTFLFTDIEGSTRLWEEHPEALREALARHDALLRETIEAASGHVFKSMGDACCAVFAMAPEAVAAALHAQQSLLTESWDVIGTLRVRMALHTGTAEDRGGDYFGPPLNRVARLLAAGHGGQILLSQATADLAQSSLPEGASLRDMGVHRLKDLQQPERLCQLLHPDLPAEFAALRSLEAFRHNLPVQLTSFVGREEPMADVKRLLATTHLLTLTGSGGCGKTRLALQVGAEVLEQFPDGVWLVELAALAEPTLVPQTVASVLGVREEPGRPILTTLAEYLRARSLLLVLDNCEHLLAACAQLAEALLRSCSELRVLASSREGLGIAGEQTYRVPSLSVPEPDWLPPLAELERFEAVRLFIDRALLSQPGFTMTEANAPPLVQIARRLDGIPLAIELAAARVKALSLQQIAGRLDDRFRLLTGGSRTALPRQQTLRALIDWSYQLLSEAERMLLQRLSVFGGGWTLGAAEAICAGNGLEEWEALDLLTALVDKSLVIYEEQEREPRYRLLETVRQYARDRLMESGEGEAVRRRHLEYFVRLAEEAEPNLRGPAVRAWLDQLETEHDNLRAAMVWSVEVGGSSGGHLEAEMGSRLAVALHRFWTVRGHLSEGRARMQELLALPAVSARTAAWAKALFVAGVLAADQGDAKAADPFLEESLAIYRALDDELGIATSARGVGLFGQRPREERRALFEESLALSRKLGNKLGIAEACRCLGGEAGGQGEYRAARAHYDESLAIYRELGDRGRIALSLQHLGIFALYQADYEAARKLGEESLAICRELGDTLNGSFALSLLGDAARGQGDWETARSLLEESLVLRERVAPNAGRDNVLRSLGSVAHHLGDCGRAKALYEQALTLAREGGFRPRIASCLEGWAAVLGDEGQPERAVRLFGAMATLREEIDSPLKGPDRDITERRVAALCAALGEDTFGAAWAEGRAMTLDQAISSALEG